MLSQGSAGGQVEEDVFMRDREHAEKRKREGRQGGAEDSPRRRSASYESDSTSVEATPRKRPSPIATRMVTRSAEKTGVQRSDAIQTSPSQGSPTPSVDGRNDEHGAPTISDVMKYLQEERAKAVEKEKEERARAVEKEKEERARAIEKENEYKKEIKQLQSTVTALALDLKSLQESVPNWGSFQSSSQITGTTDSYANVAARGVPLSGREQAVTPSRASGSRVSFDFSEQSDGSPVRSPPLSVGRSIRSAMKKTPHTQEADMIIDLKNLDMEGHTGPGQLSRTKNRILAAIRSNDGLESVELKKFMIRNTNKDVHLAYFSIGKEAEKVARENSKDWIDMFLKGAKLISPTWYPIKIDFVPRAEATNEETGKINEQAMQAFAEENGVEVKQMRWLGRPKLHATHASAVAKLATKEQVEKLLRNQRDGIEVVMFGCMLEASPFHDDRRPRACYRCQQYGHVIRECRNTLRCSRCAQEGHDRCDAEVPKCVNCQGGHPSTDKACPEYRKQQERTINLRVHD